MEKNEASNDMAEKSLDEKVYYKNATKELRELFEHIFLSNTISSVVNDSVVDVAAINKLFEHGADPNVEIGKKEKTLLFICTLWFMDVELMKTFLEHGANPNYEDKSDVYPGNALTLVLTPLLPQIDIDETSRTKLLSVMIEKVNVLLAHKVRIFGDQKKASGFMHVPRLLLFLYCKIIELDNNKVKRDSELVEQIFDIITKHVIQKNNINVMIHSASRYFKHLLKLWDANSFDSIKKYLDSEPGFISMLVDFENINLVDEIGCITPSI